MLRALIVIALVLTAAVATSAAIAVAPPSGTAQKAKAGCIEPGRSAAEAR